MKIITAIDFFNRLVSDSSNNKSERNIYNTFIGILTDLRNRNLSEIQLASIEDKLDLLNLNASPENKKRYYNKKLAEFKKYLKEQFSLISDGYYTAVGTALGVAFGAAFGSMFGMGIGITFGMLIGIIVGANMDAKAKKQNRVLIKPNPE